MLSDFCKEEGRDPAPNEEEGKEFGPAERFIEKENPEKKRQDGRDVLAETKHVHREIDGCDREEDLSLIHI